MTNIAEIVAEICHLGIFTDDEVLSYCADRNISHQTIRDWGLGAFPTNPNQLYQMYLKIHKEQNSWEFLRYIENSFESGFIRNRLIIPIKDTYGKTIALMGRTIFDQKTQKAYDIPKYYNTQYPKTKLLFGLHEAIPHILKANCVIVCEGNLDVITASTNCMKNVVATSSANLSASQFSLLSRYTENIVLAFDSDEAGDLAKDRAKTKLAAFAKKAGVTLSTVSISGAKDLDELLNKNKGEILW